MIDREVFLPIGLDQENQTTFVHALKLAWVSGSNLTLFHVNTDKREVCGDDFPSATRTLERWQGEVVDQRFKSKIIIRKGADLVDSVLFYLERSPAELIVMETRARQGLSKLMTRAISQPIASESGACVLFIPENTTGFVDPETGQTSLRRILVPVSRDPDVNLTLKYLAELLKLLDNKKSKITLFHVGDKSTYPELVLPPSIADRCQKVIVDGQFVSQIKNFCEHENPNLIVMTTQGKRGLIKMLLAGNTEQVLNTVKCAVLGVPCRDASS